MKQFPVHHLIWTTLATVAVTSAVTYRFTLPKAITPVQPHVESGKVEDCVYGLNRLSGYRFVSPLVSAETECESKSLLPLKQSVDSYIEYQQKSGTLTRASVYVRMFRNSDWTAIHMNEKFHPASLLKVPEIITFLRMAENDPGLLDRKIRFVKPLEQYPTTAFASQTLQSGHEYSIRELFHYLLAYSDNYANVELIHRMDMAAFRKTFTDLHLTPPDMSDRNYVMSAKDYSKFPEALYNTAYLTINSSEYATSLLSECNFKDGLLKGLPEGEQVAHKFGEWSDGVGYELHESGIVYLNHEPYLITVMTAGPDIHKLADVIGDLSKITYDYFNRNLAYQPTRP